MKIEFTSAAKTELYQAISYYNAVRAGLGYELAIEIDAGLDKIKRFPNAWMLLNRDLRRFLVRRFPYGIIYSVIDNTIVVVSIMNLHQDPEKWESLL